MATALGFLTACARMGMADAPLALRDVKRQRDALREIYAHADAYTPAAIKELAAHGLRRASTLKRTEKRRLDE